MNRNSLANAGIALGIVIAVIAALPLYALLLALGWAWRFWINTNTQLLGFLLYAGEGVSRSEVKPDKRQPSRPEQATR